MSRSWFAIRALLATGTVIALVAGCNRSQIEAANRAVVYSAYTSTDVPASEVFCGNRVKSRPGGPCTSKAQHADLSERSARERVEIRGWVMYTGHFADDDNAQGVKEEFVFDVLLDYGWTPGTPADANIEAINTLAAIDSIITPHNIITFGVGQQGIGSTMLDTEGRVWGGPGAGVIHVEVNGWFEAGTPLGTRLHGRPTPSDWVAASEPSVAGVKWPFDPQFPPGVRQGPLQLGDYVRVVGTLWEDEAHDTDGGPGGERGEDGKDCWCSGRMGPCNNNDYGRGWFEIHPVDYMARIDPPAPRPERMEMIAMCDESGVSRSVRPPGVAAAGVAVGTELIVNSEFTLNQSVIRLDVAAAGTQAQVDIEIDEGGSHGPDAEFKATYRAFWPGNVNLGPAPSSMPIPVPLRLNLLEDPPTEDNCSEASLHFVSVVPRLTLARREQRTFAVSNRELDWQCGPPALPSSGSVGHTRCPVGTTHVRVTRALTGREFVTECFGR